MGLLAIGKRLAGRRLWSSQQCSPYVVSNHLQFFVFCLGAAISEMINFLLHFASASMQMKAFALFNL